jgi:sugar O-acyltransferase (sialic acid O-acetyltransferase NeuD family)
MTQKTKLLIAGAGSLAKDLADLASDMPGYEVVGFVVDQPPYEHGSHLLGKPIFWIDQLEEFDTSFRAICGLAQMKKIEIIHKIKSFCIEFDQFIYPGSRISSSAKLGEGVVINSGVHVATGSQLGDFVYVNRGALIGHDTHIGQLSVISPGVTIAGNVNIGQKTFVGIGSIISERISIGEGCFICAGSLVTNHIPDRVKVIGSPARIIESDIGDFKI